MTQKVLGPTGSPRRRWTLLLPLALVTLLAAFYIPSAVAVHDLGLFQLDRNAQDVGAGDDWNTPPNPAGGDFSGIDPDIGGSSAFPGLDPGTQFQGGGSKDDLDISQWLWKPGEPLDKDDITNAYAAAYKSPIDTGSTNVDDQIIYFGLDRFSVDGSAQVGFWFVQDPAFGLTQTSSGGGFKFAGVHQNNDVLVQSTFSNGGVIGSVSVFKWLNGALVPVAGATDCLGPPVTANDDAACAVVNTATTPAPWSYTPKSGPAGTFPISAFFEAGINITRLIPGAGCFTAFMAETRSSTPFDSRLKDFVIGDLDTCVRDVRVLKTPDNGQANAGDTISFTMNVKNIGNVPADNVTMSDNLPGTGGLNWSITTQPAGNPCSITGAQGSQVLSCNFGTLAVNAEREVTISSATTSASCGAKPNTVTVSATGDIDATNNSDNGQITISCPDVSVVKTPDEPNNDINAGQNATFTMTVTNNGPGAASNVSLSDTLPTAGGLDWSITSQGAGPGFTGGSACTLSAADALSCNIGTMANGAQYRVVVSSATTVANCGTINNTVTITATGDINAANNSDPGEIDVLCAAIMILKQSTKTNNPLVHDPTPGSTADNAIFAVDGPDAGTTPDFSVTDNSAADGDSTYGEVCVSGLAPGTYTITETQAPAGYGSGNPPFDGTSLAVAGTDCGSNQPATGDRAVFRNPPLGEFTVGFHDLGSGETSATISCAPQGGSAMTAQSDANDDPITDSTSNSPYAENQSNTYGPVQGANPPNVFNCTISVDP